MAGLSLFLAVRPAGATPTLHLDPTSGAPGTAFDATYTLGEGNCADGQSVTFVWDYGTGYDRHIGAARLSGRHCKAGITASVPTDAGSGDHVVGAYVDGEEGTDATTTFSVTGETTTSTSSSSTTTTTSAETTTSSSQPPSSAPSSTSTPTPATDPSATHSPSTEVESEDRSGAPGGERSTSTSAATSTSTSSTTTSISSASAGSGDGIGCPQVLAAGVERGAAGFPVAGVTLGTTALGGAVVGGVLLVRRRFFLATVLVVIAATATPVIPAAAQTTTTPTTTTTTVESGPPAAVATFSGISGKIAVLDTEPRIDARTLEEAELGSPWTIVKALDETSPQLIEAVVTGEEFRCVELRFPLDAGGSEQAVFALAGVEVGSVHHTADGEAPVERVELRYTRLAFRYRAMTSDGELGRPIEGVLP